MAQSWPWGSQIAVKKNIYSKGTSTYFSPMFHFYTPLKTSENLMFSDIFRGCINGTLGQNGLKKPGVVSLMFVLNTLPNDINISTFYFNQVYFEQLFAG